MCPRENEESNNGFLLLRRVSTKENPMDKLQMMWSSLSLHPSLSLAVCLLTSIVFKTIIVYIKYSSHSYANKIGVNMEDQCA